MESFVLENHPLHPHQGIPEGEGVAGEVQVVVMAETAVAAAAAHVLDDVSELFRNRTSKTHSTFWLAFFNK